MIKIDEPTSAPQPASRCVTQPALVGLPLRMYSENVIMNWNKLVLAASAAASLWTGDLVAGGRRACCAPCVPYVPNSSVPNTCVTYNPCGSSYGHMLSYSDALMRAEQANVAEAALTETTHRLTAAEGRIAEMEKQLADAQASTEKAVAERDEALKVAAANEAAKKVADEIAAKEAQTAKDAIAAAEKSDAAAKAAEEARKLADDEKAKAVAAAEEATKVAAKVGEDLKTTQATLTKSEEDLAAQKKKDEEQKQQIEELKKMIPAQPEEPKAEEEKKPDGDKPAEPPVKTPAEEKPATP